MAFKKVGTLNPHGGPVLKKVILGNSITVTEVDSLKASSGFAVLGTTGALVLGHVDGLVAANQNGLESTGVAGAAFGTFAGTYLTASDNQTVGKVSALIDVSKFSMYSAEEDVAIGTTTGSNLLGYFQDLADEDTLDESTAATTTAQYFGWGVDPANSANAIVNIYESLVFGV
jgi:hypothetical protein